jgi:hypothetical protein
MQQSSRGRQKTDKAPSGKTVTADTTDPRVTPAIVGKALADPVTSSMRVTQVAHRTHDLGKGGADWSVFADELRDLSAKLRRGDLSHVEDMLMHQAKALEALFTTFAERACKCSEIPSLDLFARYALRAQSQCRQTLETLATVKNPPMVFARQANVTTGPQQVNNGVAPSRARDSTIEPNEQSGEGLELRQDTGTPALARAADTPMATVGKIDGAKDPSR